MLDVKGTDEIEMGDDLVEAMVAANVISAPDAWVRMTDVLAILQDEDQDSYSGRIGFLRSLAAVAELLIETQQRLHRFVTVHFLRFVQNQTSLKSFMESPEGMAFFTDANEKLQSYN